MRIFQPGDRLTPEDIERIVRDSSHGGPIPGDLQFESQSTPVGRHSAIVAGADFTAISDRMTSQTFLAQIRYQGPNEEPDFEDARYWVREIGDVTPQTSGTTGRIELLLDINKKENGNGDGEENGEEQRRHYAVRWVMATNLSEINPTDRENESHSFGLGEDTDDGAIVSVFDSPNMYGRRSYLFDKAIGSASRFCLPKIWNSDHPWFIEVYWIKVVLTEDNELVIPRYKVDKDNPQVIFVWPNLHSVRHFGGFIQARNYTIREYVEPGDNVLEATRVQGMWFLKQTIRWPQIMPAPQVNMRRSDCQPWSGLF